MSNIYKYFLLMVIICLIGNILILSGCKDNVTNPPEEIPAGYQEDIHWPSLMDSPWPTINSDMQRTGRSKYTGPQQGIIFAKVKAAEMQTGIAFGNDSVFYFGTSSRGVDTTSLVAAKTDGTILWSYNLKTLETTTTPLVDNNGIIYITNGAGNKIFAFNPDGTVKWTYQADRQVYNRGLGIGKDGTLYTVDNASTLIALNRDGTLLWKVQEDFIWGTSVHLTFSPDGKTLYINGGITGDKRTTLVAFDLINRSVKWKFGHVLLENGPIVDSKGNIYVLVADDSLNPLIANFYSLDPDGNIRWKYTGKGSFFWGIDPTIDKDGNIYFATDTLYALDYSGELRWKLGLGGQINYSPLICDAQGTIYMATGANFYDGKIYAVTREGAIKWTLSISDEAASGDCPAITKDGTLIYPSWRGKNLFIIK